MPIGEEIFPKGCWLAYMDDGQLSPPGNSFMLAQRVNEWEGKGAEQPCYGCGKDDCTVRVVQYHEEEKRWLVKPKFAL